MEYNLQETPDFQFLMEQAEQQMQDMMNGNPQAIMNGSVYTIPVVFHIIHLGESVGSGSNISETQVLQALDDLNSDFRDYQMTGTDVEIEFCLAQRDPQGGSQFNSAGDNITGIQRVNGTGTANYESIGITQGISGNEVEVKALSNWPNTDYLNIWVVYNIPGGVIGYATFPVADDSVDGIVIEASATGTPDLSHVISHEVGHFLDLYHTFQGSSSFNDCPSNNDCYVDGDMLCDTRPHSFLNENCSPSGNPNCNWFPCDESQYMNCDAASYTYNVTENHMNYTDNDCRNEFTPDQVMRMRCALMTLRPTLMNSLGCLPGCTEVSVDFTASATTVEEGMSITFTNQSSNATSYTWEVNDEIFSSTDLSYTFQERGFYDVCLTASNATCTNRLCIEIRVIGEDPCFELASPCDLVANGDFQESNFDYQNSSYIFGAFNASLNEVCNWLNKSASPDLLVRNDFIAASMVSFGTYLEGIVTTDNIILQAGQEYEILVEYAVTAPSTYNLPTSDLEIGLSPNTNPMYNSNFDLQLAYIQEQNFLPYTWFELSGANITTSDFTTSIICIKPETDIQGHLYVINIPVAGSNGSDKNANFLIKRIEIICKEKSCLPEPDFTFDEDCPKEFMGINTGDGDEYIWDFLCNGVTMSGQNVTIDLPVGDCEICLTAICEQETSATICKTVTIPEESTDCEPVCEDLTVYLQTCKQDLVEETTFIADFSISVPDGTEACDGVDIVSGSNQFDASASVSIEDDPNDPTLDIVNVSITFITPPGTDILNNSIAGLINLCDPDGKVICYNLICVATECTNCLGDITATATCADPNPFDDEYIYEGSVPIDFPFDGFSACDSDPVSTDVGFAPTITVNGSGSQANIDFTINTNTEGAFETSSLLYFENGGIQYCYTLIIDIDPCIEPDCRDWANKVTTAKNCTVVDGQVTYTVDMSDVWLFGSGFTDCGDGLNAYLDGSDDISLDGGTILNNGSDLNYSTTITFPCGFDTDQIYELIITACDRDGNPVCFSFNIRFPDCDADCKDDRGEDPKGRSVVNNLGNTVTMYPNPATQDVYISIINAASERNSVQIIDQLGRVTTSTDFDNEVRIDVSKLNSGLHFVRIMDSKGNLFSFEKLIILK